MKKRFILKKGDSQKFWNIEFYSCEFTVTYGKLGTEGKISSKNFTSAEKCEKKVIKLIADKIKKGYKEIEENAMENNIKNEKIDNKRYHFDYDEGNVEDLAEKILTDPCLPDLKSITVGSWGESFETNPQKIIQMIIDNKEKFQHVESLFIGDMDYEDCEVSWIIQGDYSQLFGMLPNLKVLKIKGAQSLVLGENIEHNSLKEFQIICGGLGRDVLKSIKSAKFPSLEKLLLYIGVDDYGMDFDISELKEIAKKDLFPNLTYLGFVDSDEENRIVDIILESDILPQLKIVDFSFGCLTDEGAKKLIDNKDKLAHLEKIIIEYHYISLDMIKELKSLPIEINIKKGEDPENDYMYPMLTE